MATFFGKPGNEPGDQMLYKALDNLPKDVIIYPQPKLVYKDETCYPDYVVVHKDRGVIVLEVKDWLQITNKDHKRALVYRQQIGESAWENSPIEQARSAAHVLEKMLKEDKDLVNYAGKLDFPYRYAGVLPNLPLEQLNGLKNLGG